MIIRSKKISTAEEKLRDEKNCTELLSKLKECNLGMCRVGSVCVWYIVYMLYTCCILYAMLFLPQFPWRHAP